MTPVIPLSFKYEIENTFGRRSGQSGDTCYNGDQLYFSFKAGISCWISVFGIDAKSTFPVFRNKFEPSPIEQNEIYTLDFTLDDTKGLEVYYAITASDKFDFQKEVEPHIKDIFPKASSKGIALSEYQLRLPEKFTQKFVYFNHDSH